MEPHTTPVLQDVRPPVVGESPAKRHKSDRDVSCYVYDITLSAKEDDGSLMTEEEVHQACRPICKKYKFQLEKGTVNGYMHYQGRVSLHKKDRLPAVIKLFQQHGFERFHLSVTSTNAKGDAFYIMKSQTAEGKPFTDKDFAEPRPEHPDTKTMDEKGLYSWQEKLLDLVKEYDERHIHVVIDPNGCTGKTYFRRYVYTKKYGVWIPTCITKAQDLMQFACAFSEEKLFVFDMPRAQKQEKTWELFRAIEDIKNGCLFDTRYHAVLKQTDMKNIIIFMNQEPERAFLSKDRWKLWGICRWTNNLVEWE